MAQIDSPFEFRRSKGLLDLFYFETTAPSKLCRQAMFPDQGTMVGIWRVGHSENFDDAHRNPSQGPSPPFSLVS